MAFAATGGRTAQICTEGGKPVRTEHSSARGRSPAAEKSKQPGWTGTVDRLPASRNWVGLEQTVSNSRQAAEQERHLEHPDKGRQAKKASGPTASTSISRHRIEGKAQLGEESIHPIISEDERWGQQVEGATKGHSQPLLPVPGNDGPDSTARTHTNQSRAQDTNKLNSQDSSVGNGSTSHPLLSSLLFSCPTTCLLPDFQPPFSLLTSSKDETNPGLLSNSRLNSRGAVRHSVKPSLAKAERKKELG
ncbi:hypothetical protein FALBO_7699 [Fusarium albosuccineum]|uniref:Uncharacterized protein n=1 Tax=Fusarium albosuccineum TaxID=1237068 RepID=A0A8H4LCD2_9HYPO|nr:hypothetical protein FALBO_7699 [Fusarium albosuccineum]